MEAAENEQNRSLQNVVGFSRLELSRGRIRSAEAVRGGGEIRVTAPIERGESAQRKPSSAARSCPAEAVREGWQDLHDSRHRVR